MKILYFSHSFGSPTTTFIRNETEAFKNTDSIKYICNSLHTGINKPDYVEVIPFIQNKFLGKIKWWLWKLDLYCGFSNHTFSKIVNDSIHKFKPDVIHCHFGYEALMLLDNIDDFEKQRIIIHFHGYDASAMTRKKTYVEKLKFYLSKSNVYTVSCNAYFIDRFKKEFHLPISHSFVLKCGVDTEKLFVPSELNKGDEQYIIQVSSLAEKKGQEYTIRAFKKVVTHSEYKRLKLLFTGDGERKKELLDLVRKLNLENNIIFLGTLPPKEVANYLSKATVFVHHSITDSAGDMEGIPTAIMEAMAFNLPIVSTLHSGIPELIEDGVNGYLVKEKDIDQYALRIVDALKRGMIPENRAKILNEYSVELHNKLLANYYKSCIG